MRLLSFLVTTALVLDSESRNILQLKGPPCPEGDGLYAVGCSNKYLQCVNNKEYEQSCPDGLFFDRLMARCERRSANHLCNTPNVKTLTVRQKAVSINCIGRLSGDYALDKEICNENYYQCANGISYMRKCPHGQVYSPVLKRCDYPHNCKAADGVKQYAAAAYASPTYDSDNFVVTTKEFENGHKGIDCIVQGDMYISNDGKCSPFFWQCANGKLFRKSCPSGLVYVLDQNLCDYPQGVRGCKEYDGSETVYQPAVTTTRQPRYPAPVDPMPYAPASQPPKTTSIPRYTTAAAPAAPVYSAPVTTTTAAPTTTTQYVPPQNPTVAPYGSSDSPSLPVYTQPIITYEPAVHGDCGNREGFFEIKPCHEKFLSCNGGTGRVISCAANLVFDARSGSCEYLETCQGPRMQEAVPDLYSHGGAAPENPHIIKVDFNCTGKANGEYVKEACTKHYYRCLDGRAFSQACPANLVFNKASGTCDYADNCEKNYMEPSQLYEQPTTTTTVGYAPTEPYTTQRPTTTQAPTTTTTPARDTEAPIYVPTTVGYEEPSTTTQAVYTTQTPVTTTTISLDDFNCEGLEDGNHASGPCKAIFYTCSNKRLTAIHCQAGLVFNPYVGQCDYERNVRDCRGYEPAPETTTASYTQRTTQGYAPVRTTTKRHAPVYTAPPTTTPSYAPASEAPYTQAPYTQVTYTTTQRPVYHAFCERLADGNYGKACEQYFFTCYLSETFKKDCPAGLWYSRKQDKCLHKEDVEECPGYKPTPSTTPAAEQPQPPQYGYQPGKYPNIDYTTTTPGPVDTTPIAEAFSCYNRPDGIYALPYCSKDYVQCIQGRSLVTACATGLFYSEHTGLCDYKRNVAICKRRQTDIIDNFACMGKADGSYSAGCSSNYFTCTDETIQKASCPNQLKFSEKLGKCTYPVDVAECAISNREEKMPAIPSDFCSIRQSGLHVYKQCSAHYVVCDHTRAITGSCAAPLVFNGENGLCDYKSNTKDCGKENFVDRPANYVHPTTKTQDEPESTTKPYQPRTTRSYQVTTTQKPYEEPSSTTKTYETVATTTPSRDVEVPTTTTGYTQETTTTPARDETTTTTAAPYVAPSTTTVAHSNY